MSSTRPRPRLVINHNGPRKNFCEFDPGSPNVGNLSPDLQPSSPPEYIPQQHSHVCQIGKYFLINQADGNSTFKAINRENGEEFKCKVIAFYFLSFILYAY